MHSFHVAFYQLYGIHEGMNAILDPIISEFETENQAASYDLWFRGQVQQALDSKMPRIPHDQVMAEMQAIIVQAEHRLNVK